MNSATFSKFDSKAACEESAPDFVPSHNDLVDSLPDDVIAASYRETSIGQTLWEIFAR